MSLRKMRSYMSLSARRSRRSASVSSLSSISSFSSIASGPALYPSPPSIYVTDYESTTSLTSSPPSSPRTSLDMASRPWSSCSSSSTSSTSSSPSSSSPLSSSCSQGRPASPPNVSRALNLLMHSHLPLLEEHYVNLLALSSYPSSLRSSQQYLSEKSSTVTAVAKLLAEMEEQVRVLDDSNAQEDVVGEVEQRMEGLVGLVRGIRGTV